MNYNAYFLFFNFLCYLFVPTDTNITNMDKNSYMTFRISKKLRESYHQMCEQNGYTPSKRIRALMEVDLSMISKKQNILMKNK